ncbi:fimbrial protein [Pseudoxanthomonas sp. z9]|uniref:fimbrial protein n=1 Tax=Pseudoxanthomonas sp. z9 TaxID=2584942 RepID=UPI001144FD71|nr:fimbrial protein [Pseudoxanthomonas sp. z9]
MRILIRLLALGALLVMSQKSFALVCKRDGITEQQDYPLPTTIAIAKAMPEGTIVWRSPTDTMDITCWQDNPTDYGEFVHFYPAPRGDALGPDLEMGIHFDGTDYRYSTMEPSEHGRRLPTKIWVSGCLNTYWCQVNKEKEGTKRLSYHFFFVKKSPASAEIKEGQVTFDWKFDIFQLDGGGGLNRNGGTYYMTLKNLDQLRYIACSSTIALSNPTVNFGGINKAYAQKDQVAAEKPFSITASKNCDSAYGLGALLKPIAGTTLDASHKHMLVPTDNKSIGITLHDPDNSMSVIPINEEFELVKHSTDRTVMRKFLARATWLKEPAQVQLGKFNAGATIDIYYK